MKFLKSIFCVLLVTAIAGCANRGELKPPPEGRSKAVAKIVQEAIAIGATSCRYNLEDLLVHAIGDRGSEGGLADYPVEDPARRPFSGSFVVTYKNGERSNLQIVVGKDASGFCSLYWSETRHWKKSCESVTAIYREDPKLQISSIGNAVFLSGDRTIQVLLNPLSSSSCLVTVSDMAWRVDPDETARQWIKDDHGYDPAVD